MTSARGRGTDRDRCFGHAAALALAPGVHANPVEEPTPGSGPAPIRGIAGTGALNSKSRV